MKPMLTQAVSPVLAVVAWATQAGIASGRLLSPGQPAGLLYGPRSPRYGSD